MCRVSTHIKVTLRFIHSACNSVWLKALLVSHLFSVFSGQRHRNRVWVWGNHSRTGEYLRRHRKFRDHALGAYRIDCKYSTARLQTNFPSSWLLNLARFVFYTLPIAHDLTLKGTRAWSMKKLYPSQPCERMAVLQQMWHSWQKLVNECPGRWDGNIGQVAANRHGVEGVLTVPIRSRTKRKKRGPTAKLKTINKARPVQDFNKGCGLSSYSKTIRTRSCRDTGFFFF